MNSTQFDSQWISYKKITYGEEKKLRNRLDVNPFSF